MRVEYLPFVNTPISYTWKTTDAQNIITLVDNNLDVVKSKFPSVGDEVVSNGFLTELRATASIISIPEAPLPDIDEAVDTESTRLAKALETKWNNARIHLEVLTSGVASPSISDWDSHGFVSMQNSAGYPYEWHDLKRVLTPNIAYEIGSPGKIGVRVKSVMFNNQTLMLTGDDSLTFRGSFRQEIHSVQPDILPQPTIIQGTINQISQAFDRLRWTILVNSRSTIMDLRDTRFSGLIRNIGNNTVYVREGNLVTVNNFTYTITPGGERNTTVGYNGIITAISSSSGSTNIETEEKYNVPLT